MTLNEENYWRGYIDAKVEDMGRVRAFHPSTKEKLAKRDELLAAKGLTP